MKENTLEIKQEKSLIRFPCNFPIKVMGAAIPEFHQRVLEIVLKHDPSFNTNKTKQRNSKTGKYTSLTLNIHAQNKQHLDAIYQDLSNCELVLWAL